MSDRRFLPTVRSLFLTGFAMGAVFGIAVAIATIISH